MNFVSAACFISVDLGNIKGIFVMDVPSGKFYEVPLKEVDEETSKSLMSAIKGEMLKSNPSIPTYEIEEVMNSQKEIRNTPLKRQENA